MKKENRGGYREGSGAKKKDPFEKRVKTSIQIPKWMLEQIDLIAGPKKRSQVVIDILGRHFFKK